VFGIFGFLVYHRRSSHSWGWFDNKSHGREASKSKNGCENYATPDFDVVEGEMKADGKANRVVDKTRVATITQFTGGGWGGGGEGETQSMKDYSHSYGYEGGSSWRQRA
jgi:hypothetical protein